MTKKILYLTLKKKWFDLTASGKKKVEYREVKPYWTKRLFDRFSNRVWLPKIFDEVYFRNGYSKNSPFMHVKWLGTGMEKFEGKLCYAIRLGKILELAKNGRNKNNPNIK